MSYSGMTFGDISPRVGFHSVGEMLAHAQPNLVLEKFAKTYPMPKQKGQMIKFRRPIPFDVSTTALTEGVTPTPQILSYEDLSASLAQYGGWVPITDVIMDTHEDPNLKVINQLLGEQAASVKEALLWGELRGGTSVFFTGTAAARGQVEDILTLDELRAATRLLKANHAKPITQILKASVNIATEPVAPAFVAVGHSNFEQDLRGITGFLPRENYSDSTKLIDPNEIGKVEDIRFVLTPHLEPFFGSGAAYVAQGVLNNGANVDVYPMVIFGQDAFAVVPLKGASSVQMAVKNPKMGENETDPLGQRGFVSWKMWFVAMRLNETWMTRIEAAVSAL